MRPDLGAGFIQITLLVWMSWAVGPWQIGLLIFSAAWIINIVVSWMIRKVEQEHGRGVVRMIFRKYFNIID